MKNTVTLLVSTLVMLALFCVTLKNSCSATFQGVPAMAVCTEVVQPSRHKRSRGFSLTRWNTYRFRYTDQDGATQIATAGYGAFWVRPKEGDSVPIIYVKGSPSLIYYDSVFHVWMFPAILGGLLVAIGARQVIKRR